MSIKDPTGDRLRLDVTYNPIQRSADGDRLLQIASFGGPDSGRDCRFYLDRKVLQELLDIASHSGTQRVVINRAGVKVQLYADRNGHQYEVWTLIGDPPKPERNPLSGLVG